MNPAKAMSALNDSERDNGACRLLLSGVVTMPFKDELEDDADRVTGGPVAVVVVVVVDDDDDDDEEEEEEELAVSSCSAASDKKSTSVAATPSTINALLNVESSQMVTPREAAGANNPLIEHIFKPECTSKCLNNASQAGKWTLQTGQHKFDDTSLICRSVLRSNFLTPVSFKCLRKSRRHCLFSRLTVDLVCLFVQAPDDTCVTNSCPLWKDCLQDGQMKPLVEVFDFAVLLLVVLWVVVAVVKDDLASLEMMQNISGTGRVF